MNPRLCQMLGRPAEELVTKSCEDITHPEDWHCNRQMIEELIRGERREFSIDKRYARADGSWLWVKVSVTMLPSGQGDGRLLAVIEDINDAKLLQIISAELIQDRDPTELYRDILDVTVRLMGAQRGSIQRYDAETGMLQLIATQGVDPALCEKFAVVSESSGTSCALALASRQRTVIADYSQGAYRDSPAGRAHRDRGVLAAQSTPLITRSGELVGMLSTHWTRPHLPSERSLRALDILARQVADLIERRKSQEVIRQAHRELHDFTENASVAMHWVGPDGTILWANRAELEMLGYSPDEYVGRSIVDFHVDPPVIDDILCRLNDRQTIRDYEARLRRKDGEVLYVQITSDVRWEGDPPRFVHTRCFTRDITQRRRAEAELRQNEAWIEAQKEALQSALNGEPLEASLRVLVNGAVAYFGADTRTAFYLANASGTALHHIVGMPPEYAALVDGFKITLESFSCGLAACTRTPILTADVEEEPRWKSWLPIAQRFDFRACWSFPCTP